MAAAKSAGAGLYRRRSGLGTVALFLCIAAFAMALIDLRY
jgi:hypothetical protein